MSKRGCFFRNARARNTHVEATLNHPCAAQVCLQAAANAVFAQLARDVVGALDLPGAGEHLAASGGGVIFAFLLFSRQANWKRKVALAGTLLDRHMPRGVPPRAAAGLGL